MLFRKESVKAQQNRLTGKVILLQPLPVYAICTITSVFFALVVMYISQSHYSRKENVAGYLLPAKGVVKVYSDRVGVVGTLFIKEGEYVQQGQPLVKIRNSRSLLTGIELSTALSKKLIGQIASYKQELKATLIMYKKDASRITEQINQFKDSLSSLQRAKLISEKRLLIKKNQYNNNKVLSKKGYVSPTQLSVIQDEYLELLEENEIFDKDLSSLLYEISTLESEKSILPEKKILKKVFIERLILELQAQLVELKNQFEFIKKAPESGIITAIRPTLGMHIDLNEPILSILPIDSPLEIELLLPTRSAGFVQIGDPVKIRFDAFPYQKFGLVQGEVINVDKALILPRDKKLPVEIGEPIYRVRAKLKQQSITAYGETFSFKAGMIANVDIVLDERSLLDWLLDPIYIIKGNIE